MSKKRKNIVILGSTGSIGENAIKVIQSFPEEFYLYGVASGANFARLSDQANEFNCKYAVIADKDKYIDLKKGLPAKCTSGAGVNGMEEMVSQSDVDLVVCAIVGSASLLPLLAAIRAGKDIALASKEALVMAGSLVMSEAKKYGVSIIPIDSEHSAVFQCLEGNSIKDVSRIILTASGGAFRNWSLEEIKSAKLADALKHPTWNMGVKVTIDSATLMNKALEIIEAKWLFDIPGKNIDVVIHHQSIVHSMVEFIDGNILAQMGIPDMRSPIQYALTYPEKFQSPLERFDFAKLANLSFQIPDKNIFPSLEFAYEAMRVGGTMPVVMNAANEVAVKRFCDGEISFTDIWKIIENAMSSHKSLAHPSLDAILSADKTMQAMLAMQA